jgi:phosphoglycerol transferase MdoB-like AlkP superfamily enzyme
VVDRGLEGAKLSTSANELTNILENGNGTDRPAASDEAVSHRWTVAGAFLFYAVLMNVPYWIADRTFRLENLGYLALEYAAVGILAMYVPWVVSSFLLLVLVSADLLFVICTTYYLSVEALLSNFTQVGAFPVMRQLKASAIFMLILGMVLTSAFIKKRLLQPKSRKIVALFLMGFAILVEGIDLVSQVNLTEVSLTHLRKERPDGLSLNDSISIARNPVLRLIHLEQFDRIVRGEGKLEEASLHPMPNAAEVGLRDAGVGSVADHSAPNVVLVLLESWGRSTNENLNEALLAPYAATGVSEQYRIEAGAVPFFSSTVPGEIRELCGNSSGFHVLDASTEELKHCKTSQFAAHGYRTVALHGMNGNMFSRTNWYPKMGFQEILFNDDFRQMGLADCAGAFVGTCDADVAALIGKRLGESSSQPLFLHWVTLGSHLPVAVPSGLRDGARCSTNLPTGSDPTLCAWYQLVFNVHQSMAQIATEKLARPTVFIIVGDHAPPFGSLARRDLFSQQEVPYVVLVPREKSAESTEKQ